MSEHKSIPSKIDELFIAHAGDRPDALKAYADRLLSVYGECRKAEAKSFVLLVLVWLGAVLVGMDVVAEAGVSSVKLKNSKYLLLLAAPGIGFFGHNLIVLFARTINLWQAIRQCYKHMLPKAYELDLEDFVLPPSFDDMARISLKRWSKASGVWTLGITLMVILLPGVLIAHLCFLLYGDPFAPVWLRVASPVAGFSLWVHGLWLMWGTVTESEGDD